MEPMWRWLAFAVVLGATPLASANGRAPLTNGIVLRPGHPNSIYLATTFGLLGSLAVTTCSIPAPSK